MLSYLHLAAGALLLFVGFRLLVRGARLATLLRELRRLRPTPLREVEIGLHQTRARIRRTESLLKSPYQKRECAYYFFRVSSATQGPRRKALATGKEWALAEIEDATGRARIEPWTAIVASPHKFTTTLGPLETIPPDLVDFFQKAGIDEKHLPRLGQMTVEEYTLEPEDEVYVTGTVRTEGGAKIFHRPKRGPLIVSAEADIGYTKGLRHELFLYTAIPPLVIVAGIILSVLAFA